MSTKVMITYKRKRAASHAHTEEDTTLDSSPAASSNVAVSSLQLKSEGPSETTVINGDNHTTPKRQRHFSMLQQNIKEECEPEKGQDQLYESLPRKEQPEICSATIASTAEAHSNKSQCIDDTNNQNHVSSSVCDLMLADGTINRTKGSKISAPVEINSPTGTEIAVVPGQCKKRFSPLLTFHRRVKKKTNLDEPAEEICSPNNDKQCSTLTCSPPRSSLNGTPLLKHTAPNSLDSEDKQPINSLPQWLTKDAETGTSRINPEMWPSMVPAPGRSAADPPRGGSSLFCDDVKPHVLPEARDEEECGLAVIQQEAVPVW